MSKLTQTQSDPSSKTTITTTTTTTKTAIAIATVTATVPATATRIRLARVYLQTALYPEAAVDPLSLQAWMPLSVKSLSRA